MSQSFVIRHALCALLTSVVASGWLTSTAEAQDSSCEDWKLSWINDAKDEALAMVREPLSSARFQEWFGPDHDGDDWDFVRSVGQRVDDGFSLIGSAARHSLGLFPEIVIGCGCKFNQRDAAEADPGAYSFRICDSFFNSLGEGQTRGGILIHEVAHLAGAVDTQHSDTFLDVTSYDYSRLLVSNPQSLIDANIGTPPNLNAGFTWPMAEAENYRFFFENPDDQ